MTQIGLRERRKQTTRTALVDAGLRLFDERGYTEVTVEDICAAAEVSPRTFFRYFAGKDNLVAEPITLVLGEIRTTLAAQPRAARVWPALRASLTAAAETIEQHRTAFARASRVIRDRPGALASSAGAIMEWELTVRGEVAARLGVPADELHPRLILGVTMVALRGALERWTEGGEAEPIAELVEQALTAVEPGVKALERAVRRSGEGR